MNRLLVVLPSWLGDCVMATPTLRALRELYPEAHITGLMKRDLRPLLAGNPWLNRTLALRAPRAGAGQGRRGGLLGLARHLAAGRFDAAVLLPNSFRWALVARLARIPRRLGYDRDARGGLLTDRLLPRRAGGRFVPVPTLEYYLGIARYLGARGPTPAMELHTDPRDDARAGKLLRDAGYTANAGRPLVLLNPGANYGDAKMWPPERFAAVAEGCAQRFGAAVAISGAPRERAILDRVIAAARTPLIDLPRLGVDLRLLKSVVRASSVMVTNDTGPRHMAAALGVPVVTIFGPTDPAWTTIDFAAERQVMVKVFCGPCQKKKCPLDHRCMTQIEPEMVLTRTAELLAIGLGGSGASAGLATAEPGPGRPAGTAS